MATPQKDLEYYGLADAVLTSYKEYDPIKDTPKEYTLRTATAMREIADKYGLEELVKGKDDNQLAAAAPQWILQAQIAKRVQEQHEQEAHAAITVTDVRLQHEQRNHESYDYFDVEDLGDQVKLKLKDDVKEVPQLKERPVFIIDKPLFLFLKDMGNTTTAIQAMAERGDIPNKGVENPSRQELSAIREPSDSIVQSAKEAMNQAVSESLAQQQAQQQSVTRKQ